MAVMPSGAKYWRYDYRYHGKQSTLALSVYSAVSAREARQEHQAARAQLDAGPRPWCRTQESQAAQSQPMADDFESIARALWISKRRAGRSEGYVKSIIEKSDLLDFFWSEEVNLSIKGNTHLEARDGIGAASGMAYAVKHRAIRANDNYLEAWMHKAVGVFAQQCFPLIHDDAGFGAYLLAVLHQVRLVARLLCDFGNDSGWPVPDRGAISL